MTSFANVFGYQSNIIVDEDDNTVEKEYNDMSQTFWERIKNNAKFLSEQGLGPQVINTFESPDSSFYAITYEKVMPLSMDEDDPSTKYLLSKYSKEEIIAKIGKLVDQLHTIGYGHGDLHIGNIGYIHKDEKFVILDHDTTYLISDGIVDWFGVWMKEGYDWEETLEEFIDLDYYNWRTDWLF